MAIIKCKMCGGALSVIEGDSTAECEYCGSVQTVPKVDDEKKLTLFGRANRLRLACEFDKAAGIYESIVADFPEEAEAYWGLVLCKYGIEYVDDPATGKKVPTCHRSSFDSIMADADFEQAVENADAIARRVYCEEAKKIEEIRKGIIAVSNNEQPYDIFICYKDTVENGERTIDSVLAQDVYNTLTDKGYRVFFSRITLEDKLGMEYEPYIFAALNSAKVMLAFGTNYEYFNAVWVKNEWSRFLKLMAKDKDKHLIPCFKGIDACDMPKEFTRLQAQDLGKVGAVQDLLRGIEKLLPQQQDTMVNHHMVPEMVATPGNNTASLLERAFLFLEDGDWNNADVYCEKVLDIEPKNPMAYVGKLMVERKRREMHALKNCGASLCKSDYYAKAIRFADSSLKQELENLEKEIQQRFQAEREVAELAQKDGEVNKARLEQLRKKLASVGKLIKCVGFVTIGLRSDGTVVAVGDNEDGQCNVSGWRDVVDICTGISHTVGLRSDGTVVTVGDNEDGRCKVSKWNDIVAISAGGWHTVGLCSDGTVVAVGDNNFGQCGVTEWKDIVAISASEYHTVGLCSDGTVVAEGYNEKGQCNVSEWRRIVAISASDNHTVGLCSDGTVVATGDNDHGQCNVSDWTDIVAVSVDGWHTVGLRSDGTVVAAGSDKGEVSKWKDVVAIGAFDNHIVGLCSDGTVVDADNWYDISEWEDIVAICGGSGHIVGLRSDGTVVAEGYNENGQCNVSDWKLFEDYENLDQARVMTRMAIPKLDEEKRIAREKREKEKRIAEQRRNDGLCQHCGGSFKGLFTKKCVNCGKPKDY